MISPDLKPDGGGLRYDDGKARYDLIPPEVLEALAHHYRIGAAKYTQEFEVPNCEVEEKLVELCSCQSPPTAILPARFTRGAYVAPATNGTCESETPSSRNASGRTLDDGTKATPRKFEPERETDKQTLQNESEMRRPSGPSPLENLGSAKSHSSKYWSDRTSGAEFAGETYESGPRDERCSGSTTTTQQEHSGGFSAMDATSASANLATLKKLLSAHSRTCAVRSAKLSAVSGGVKFYLSGERNWERGMKWGRVFGSLMRHCWAFWRGETYDEDTGSHHMIAAMWNCAALFTYDEREIGEDDRMTG